MADIDQLTGYWQANQSLAENYERLAALDVAGLWEGQPDLMYSSQQDVKYTVVKPAFDTDYDESELTVMPAAFTRPYDNVTLFRARSLAECLGTAVVVFPNTILNDESMYGLSKQDKAGVRSGNFDSIGVRQAAVIESLLKRYGASSANFVNYSIATRIGLSAASASVEKGVIGKGSVTQLEPIAYGHKVGQFGQGKLVKKGGREHIDKKLGASDPVSIIPDASGGLAKKAGRFIQFFGTNLMSVNRALAEGMGTPNFAAEVHRASSIAAGMKAVLPIRMVGGETSLVAVHEVMEKAARHANDHAGDSGNNVGVMTVPGGHEALGGLAVFVLAAHLAREDIRSETGYFDFPRSIRNDGC